MTSSRRHPPRTAFYPGSFDPVTNGHIDVIRQALTLADHLVIGVGVHSGKTTLFSAEERIAMLKEACGSFSNIASLDIVAFDDLTVAAARRLKARLLIRGLRDGTDLDYEMQLAAMNAALAPDLQTVFVPSSPLVRPISATLVRQISSLGGDVSAFVPEGVPMRLRAHISIR